MNSRSLLSGKSLEEDFRFAVDAQVIDSFRVCGCCVGALRELAQRSRAHRTESLLHRNENCVILRKRTLAASSFLFG